MLVLSRCEEQKILFPSLDIVIEVLRIRGRVASIGIEAPPEVPIQRAEIVGLKSIDFPPDDETLAARLRRLTRLVRSHLDSTTEQLNTLHEKLEAIRPRQGGAKPVVIAAQQTVLEVFRELSALDRELAESWQSEDDAPAQSPRALVVEPDENQRELLAGALRMAGFFVAAAEDGGDALDYLSLHAVPDVMLSELNMPRCTGPQLFQRVLRDPNYDRLKLYAISRGNPAEQGVVVGQGGIAGWFEKPVSPEPLTAALLEAVSPCRSTSSSSTMV